MRKLLISAALAASTLAVAAPAAAQWEQPVPQGYGYGYQNYGYGNSNAYRQRVDQIQRQIRNLDQRNVLSNSEARRLMDESNDLERRIANLSRYGLNSNEARDIQYRINRLEQRVFQEANDGNRYPGNRYGYDRDNRYNNGYGNYERDLANIRVQIDQGARSGRLTGREEAALRRDLYVVDRALNKYRANGMTRNENWDMDRRIRALEESVRRASRDADRR